MCTLSNGFIVSLQTFTPYYLHSSAYAKGNFERTEVGSIAPKAPPTTTATTLPSVLCALVTIENKESMKAQAKPLDPQAGQ